MFFGFVINDLSDADLDRSAGVPRKSGTEVLEDRRNYRDFKYERLFEQYIGYLRVTLEQRSRET